MSKLDCAQLEVNLDGTADYTSIQSAINSANDNDVILVHPGRYIERLNTNGKDLTLQSLYNLISTAKMSCPLKPWHLKQEIKD